MCQMVVTGFESMYFDLVNLEHELRGADMDFGGTSW